nr:cupin domain-containing protein [uncultured Ottowia sp.]
MKPFQTIAQSIGLATLLAFGAAAQAADVALTPNEMAFKDGRAVLDDNSEFTTKTIRVTIEPNKKLEPHGPKEGYFFVTVISGTLELGFGKTYDEAKLKTLPPGSIFTHPAGQLHFAKTGKDPVVLQITVIKPKGSADKSEH